MLWHIRTNPIIGMGIFDKNPMRLDCEEAARLAGLDILINGVVNMWERRPPFCR